MESGGLGRAKDGDACPYTARLQAMADKTASLVINLVEQGPNNITKATTTTKIFNMSIKHLYLYQLSNPQPHTNKKIIFCTKYPTTATVHMQLTACPQLSPLSTTLQCIPDISIYIPVYPYNLYPWHQLLNSDNFSYPEQLQVQQTAA